MKSTNYINTFIEVSDDCPVDQSQVPPIKTENKSSAALQFEMIKDHPYKYTSDDVLFTVYAIRNKIPKKHWESERQKFFHKGQPCLRASPLTKRYGWGVHSDDEGKIALYRLESDQYRKFLKDQHITKTKAMRSKRK